MARGQQKIQSQQKNLKRQQAKAKSNAPHAKESAQKALTLQCKICLAQFQNTKKASMLQDHVDSKHAKNSLKECFPTWEPAPVKATKDYGDKKGYATRTKK